MRSRSIEYFTLRSILHRDKKGMAASLDSHQKEKFPLRKVSPARFRFRLFLLIAGTVLLFFVMQSVLNPFGNNEYAEIPHGNHSHYVPRDRDLDVPISNFPTRPPADNERITPDGRIVPK